MAGIILKIVVAAILLVGGFLAAHFMYFQKYPLWNIPYLAQTLAAFLAAAIGFYVIPYLYKAAVKGIKAWLSAVIRSSVSQSVGAFMASQAGRVREARGRARGSIDNSKKKNGANSQFSTFNSQFSTILDTSAVIDGRVFDLIKLEFLDGPVLVPNFVVNELQTLADSSDDLKRGKGRRGLDLLEDLKKEIGGRFVLLEEEVSGKDVDEKLMRLARKIEARVATVDFNLNKTARVSGLTILNVNDLANKLKTPVVPGDKLNIKIVHEGKDKEQGVGYLPDGTMIVVEGAKSLVGSKVDAEVTRFLQTSAGKMVFAKISSASRVSQIP